MNIAIQQKDARLKLGYMLRGESLTIEGIIDYNVHFNEDGFFIVNGTKISQSVNETIKFLWNFNFKYSRRKQSIQYKYWRKHPLDITKYFPEPVHPEIFTKFVARNQAMISGADIEVKSFCRNCAAIYTDCPRDHHPACFQYLDQDKYPEYNYVNPLGHCPKCDSDDGLSIDSCREMEVSVIDCCDCGFRFEGKCPEDVLEKRFKKKFKNKKAIKEQSQ